MATLREQVDDELASLSEPELAELLRYIRVMRSAELPSDYDPDNDPAIGFIRHPVDIEASQAKDFFRQNITARSGWTQKKD